LKALRKEAKISLMSEVPKAKNYAWDDFHSASAWSSI
jgi:hypothetical protein